MLGISNLMIAVLLLGTFLMVLFIFLQLIGTNQYDRGKVNRTRYFWMLKSIDTCINLLKKQGNRKSYFMKKQNLKIDSDMNF